MLENNQKIRYILYARKSTEGEDKQVQSIDDQIEKLKQLASKNNLKIVEILEESKSAKTANNRPVFNKMIEKIEAGEADGILCWQNNRIARNMEEGGRVINLLQNGIIKSIRTYEKEHLPEDNVLFLCFEMGVANQFSVDLSKNVKRGLESKLKKGWAPNQAPIGYLNSKIKERGENDILPDPDRFDLVRKMWDLMLTGIYNPEQIRNIANKEWGFRTKKTKRFGGNELSRSVIYKMFTNPFFAQIIEYKGKQYNGVHKKMVTLEEFDAVQFMLGRKGKPRTKTRNFAFTAGNIRCGECSCFVTAETKTKLVKRTGKLKDYTYYRCTHQKKGYKCTQKAITVEDLEAQIMREICKFTILPEFRDLALEIINKENAQETHTRQNIFEMQAKALVDTQNQIDKLFDMKLKEQITDEEYNPKRTALVNEKKQLEQKLKETSERADSWQKKLGKAFDFARDARDAFLKGGIATKKEIFVALGSNFLLKDSKLSLEGCSWLEPIIKDYPAIETDLLRLELREMLTITDQKAILDELNLRTRALRDSNPQPSGSKPGTLSN